MPVGGRWRPAVTRLLLAALVACLLTLSLPRLGLPYQVRMLPGELREVPIARLVGLDPAMMAEGAKRRHLRVVRTPTGLSLMATEPGRVELSLRLLGAIPLGQVLVDVVPQAQVVPGGQAIGVLLSGNGLVVERAVPVIGRDGKTHNPAREAGILPGDRILEAGGQSVQRFEQLQASINAAGAAGQELVLMLERNGRRFGTSVRPVPVDSGPPGSGRVLYRIGLNLKAPTAGVGTLTFHDPVTGRFGALGHLVTDEDRRPAEVRDGRLVRAQISGIHRGSRGEPGEKLGVFQDQRDVIGTIEANTPFGIYGHLWDSPGPFLIDTPVPVALAHQVRPGLAQMLTVLEGNRIESFDIEILRVDPEPRPDGRGLVIRVVDDRLLSRTRGIIQGMSGSPILQGGRLVGAVTHVLLHDPTRGFGVLAEWMVYEAGLMPSTDAGTTGYGLRRETGGKAPPSPEPEENTLVGMGGGF